MTDKPSILADLARAKAAFQQRAIAAIITEKPTTQNGETK